MEEKGGWRKLADGRGCYTVVSWAGGNTWRFGVPQDGWRKLAEGRHIEAPQAEWRKLAEGRIL